MKNRYSPKMIKVQSYKEVILSVASPFLLSLTNFLLDPTTFFIVYIFAHSEKSF